MKENAFDCCHWVEELRKVKWLRWTSLFVSSWVRPYCHGEWVWLQKAETFSVLG